MPSLFLPAYRVTRRDLRLGSGLVLFGYVTAHFINHAIGLVSVNAAEAGLRIAVAFWHSLPGTVLLYSAAGIHLALAMVAVYERRTLRMPAPEAVRIALGFGIPLLLIGHFTSTRFAFELYGLRIGEAVTQLHRFSRMDDRRSSVEIQNLKFASAELFHGKRVVRSLFRGGCFRGSLLDLAILLPAHIKSAADVDDRYEKDRRSIEKGIAKAGKRFVVRILRHRIHRPIQYNPLTRMPLKHPALADHQQMRACRFRRP